MGKFIPQSLLDFITERISFCETIVDPKYDSNDNDVNYIIYVRATLSDLILAKERLLSFDTFKIKQGMYVAKRFLNECILAEESSLFSNKKYFTRDRIEDTIKYLDALKRIYNEANH